MKKDAFLVLRGVRQRLCCEVVQLIGVFPSLSGDPCEPLQGNFFFHYIACAGYSRGCTYQLLTLFCLICLLFFFSSRVGATIQLLSCFSFFFFLPRLALCAHFNVPIHFSVRLHACFHKYRALDETGKKALAQV